MESHSKSTVDELWKVVQQQAAELAELRAWREELQAASVRPSRAGKLEAISRAGLLKVVAAGAVATTLAAGSEIIGGTATALANGQTDFTANTAVGGVVRIQNLNTGSTAISLFTYGDGTAEDPGFISCFGFANQGTGVYAQSVNGPKALVAEADALNSTGVTASGGQRGVYGYTDSNSSGAYAVQGEITQTSPGSASAAIYGQNDGTGANGFGVYGTQNGSGWGGFFTTPSGTGVYAAGGSGKGVHGNAQGLGVYGEATNSAGGVGRVGGSAYGVQGVVLSTSPAATSAGVLGQNNGTTGNGYGVQGTHAGGGWGGYFTSHSGIAAYGNGGTGTGLLGTSTSGIGVYGTSSSNYGCYGSSTSNCGVYGKSANSTGVIGDSTNWIGVVAKSVQSYGIVAQSTNSYGVHATGTTGLYASGSSGRGAILTIGAAAAAQLQLLPSGASTHPSSGQAGDLFVDSADNLWFCKGGSTWVQLA